jgi:hypothetical protein
VQYNQDGVVDIPAANDYPLVYATDLDERGFVDSIRCVDSHDLANLMLAVFTECKAGADQQQDDPEEAQQSELYRLPNLLPHANPPWEVTHPNVRKFRKGFFAIVANPMMSVIPG